ncbi:MAG: hypothetical protein P1U32_05185 [Legionellaceae bacterium]|nr:hypothetical protein [Legionellaceae bacterium]
MTPHRIFSESTQITTQAFKHKIMRCLELLKQKAPDYYGLFCLFNICIRATDERETCANLENNTIDFNSNLEEDSDTIVASEIIHETIHFWQDKTERFHFDPQGIEWLNLSHKTMELEAFKHQIAVLELIGGEEEHVAYLKKQRGTHNGIYSYEP